MAFTGVAVIQQVADDLVRITGVSLIGGASGTIGLHEDAGTPNVRLPAAFKPRDFTGPEGQHVALQDSIQVQVIYVATGSSLDAIRVVKTGTTPENFVATLTNEVLVEGPPSGNLEIYVRFH